MATCGAAQGDPTAVSSGVHCSSSLPLPCEARLPDTRLELAGQEASFASERENWRSGQGEKLKHSAVYPSGQDLGAEEGGEHPDALGRTEQSSSLPDLFGGLHSIL